MGKVLAAYFKDQLYGIGLFMANGTTVLNNGAIITVKPPMPGSLEELLLQTGYGVTFVETDGPLFFKPLSTWHWGRQKQKLDLRRSFDAVVLVNGVGVPAYLP